MTQEEKDLLVKDLSARLPYGVILKTDNVFPQKLEGISFDKDTFLVWVSDGGFTLDCMDCKPYLFPLSSMTDEQEAEWDDLYITPLCERMNPHTRKEDLMLRAKAGYAATFWLLENHFDYLGLIEKGLAIDATGLKIY